MNRYSSMLLLLLATMLAATTTTLAAASAYSHSRMLCLVNRQRQQHGRSPLGSSAPLDRSSLQHSQYQASIRKMTHNDRLGRSLGTRVEQLGYRGWRGVAENIAYGQDSEEDVMQQWMDSPGHRKNILGDYTHLGSAVAYSGDTPYYTQNFASDGKRHSFPVCPDDDDSDDNDSSYGNDDDNDDDEDADSYTRHATKKRPSRTIRTIRRVKASPRKLVRVIRTWVKQKHRPSASKPVIVRKQSVSGGGKDNKDEDCDDDSDSGDQAKSSRWY